MFVSLSLIEIGLGLSSHSQKFPSFLSLYERSPEGRETFGYDYFAPVVEQSSLQGKQVIHIKELTISYAKYTLIILISQGIV